MTQQLLTADAAAAELDVPRARIDEWKSRGRVTPAGLVPGRGRDRTAPLYRLEDLKPLADAYHRRQTSRDTHLGR